MNSFSSGNIEKCFEWARNNPLNKNCSYGEIALLVFYHLVSDEDLKNNGNQIKRFSWLYGVKCIVVSI